MIIQPFRLDPAMPASAYTTYQILAPKSTHFRRATCAEVDCPQYLRGWITRVDEATDLGAQQAHYIRRESGRAFTEQRTPVGLTIFTFGAGQRCFDSDSHWARLDRPEIYVRRGGDWRGNPRREVYTHTRAEHWVEDFGEHQQRLHDRLERG